MQRYIERANRRRIISDILKYPRNSPPIEWVVDKIYFMPGHLRNTCCSDIEEIIAHRGIEFTIYYPWMSSVNTVDLISQLKGKGLM